MSWRAIALSYAVLAVLAAYYFGFERPPRPHPVHRGARPHLVDFRADDIRELRLLRGGNRIVCRRKGERWVVVEPLGAAVPSDLVAALVDGLAGGQGVQVVRTETSNAAGFGLDEGTRVEFVVRGRERPVEVVLGGLNPTRTAVYARRIGAPFVYLLGRNIRYYEDLIFAAAGGRGARPGPQPERATG